MTQVVKVARSQQAGYADANVCVNADADIDVDVDVHQVLAGYPTPGFVCVLGNDFFAYIGFDG